MPSRDLPSEPRWTVVVHGGAGELEPERTALVRTGCELAAVRARSVLEQGGTALDAVETAVRALEADPQFNAGLGSALTREGQVEVDAAIMVGQGLRIGAVGAVPDLRHPVILARRVLEAGDAVLLVGPGALAFGQTVGILPDPPGALVTNEARERLARWQSGLGAGSGGGTVGAVALDLWGGLAAATSTGGMTGKRPGRVGDSPIVGAGTYADDGAACSATGRGEAILRVLLAHDAVQRVRAGESPAAAARAALEMLRARTGGTAGLILVDRQGEVGLAHTTGNLSFAVARAANPEIESGTCVP